VIGKIAVEILTQSKAYENLRTLTKSIGPRLSGSPQTYTSEKWGEEVLKKSGLPGGSEDTTLGKGAKGKRRADLWKIERKSRCNRSWEFSGHPSVGYHGARYTHS